MRRVQRADDEEAALERDTARRRLDSASERERGRRCSPDPDPAQQLIDERLRALAAGGPTPSTPLAGAQHAARLLGNAVPLTHDGYGHMSNADPSTCVEQALPRYVVDLVTPPRGTVCPSDRQPFDPEFGKPLP